jgi:hypothetical protein
MNLVLLRKTHYDVNMSCLKRTDAIFDCVSADLQAADITTGCAAMGGGPHISTGCAEAWTLPQANHETFAAGTFSAGHRIAVLQEHVRNI